MSKFFNTVDLPKSSSSDVLHPLVYPWSVWYHSKNKVTGEGSATEEMEWVPEQTAALLLPLLLDNYLLRTKLLTFNKFGNEGGSTKEIDTVEQLWTSLTCLKNVLDLPVRSEFLIFKSGVKPIWEDPVNAKGGRWTFRFSHRPSMKKRAAVFWERLVLKVCGGSLFSEDEPYGDILYGDISGLVSSVRKDDIKISIWNTNLFMDRYNEKYGDSTNDIEEPEDENDDLDVQDDKKNRKLSFTKGSKLIYEALLRILRETDAIIKTSDITLETRIDEKRPINTLRVSYSLHESVSNPSNQTSYNQETNGNQYRGHQYLPHQTSNRPFNRRYNNNPNNHGHRQHRDRERDHCQDSNIENNSFTPNGGNENGMANKSLFANLGRRRRGIEEGVEGGEPSGLLFGARRKQMHLLLLLIGGEELT